MKAGVLKTLQGLGVVALLAVAPAYTNAAAQVKSAASSTDLAKRAIPEATITRARALKPMEFKLPPRMDNLFDRGGKILWYESAASVGEPMGTATYDRSVRLFGMPGMAHCLGGVTGCDAFDKLDELDRWAQSGTAPDRIIAAKLKDGKAFRTHPLCAYPKVARYSGSGDLNDAANFACVSNK